MRAIWTGAVAFGLVNVPVKLYSATASHDVDLHQVHDADGGRIRYKRTCEKCGKVVAFENIDRAYDDGTHTVVLTDEDFERLPAERNREIEVVEFVPSEQVDPIRFDKSYYLEPDPRSVKAYVLLRRTLESTDRTAIVRFALRQRTRLGALRVHDDTLLLQGLLWDDEVRAAEFESLGDAPKISAKELELAKAVVAQLEDDFTPSEYVDEYQAQLRDLIDAKLEKGDAIETPVPEDDGEGAEVLDLMEALRRSVSKKRGGSAGSADEKSGAKSAAKKATPARSGAKTSSKSAKSGGSGASAKKAASKKDSKDGDRKSAAS
ncbi:MAG: Ku protein [Actinomycetota bacterium]|nr:Ku protein [Actinomycetota bacterium]